MPAATDAVPQEILWTIFGAVGAVIFYGRFYVQWLASERRKRSVIPISFWYMSGAGAVLQFIYAVHRVSPGAAFGYCFNLILYTRNLIHIWRERGRLTRALNVAAHSAAAVMTAIAVVLMAMTWFWEYQATQSMDSARAEQNWFWLGIWGAGQVLFFLRFLIQWVVSEMKKKSIVPPVFWYLSVIAATLQSASFIQRQDWIFAIGMVATIFIYARNIVLVRREQRQAAEAPACKQR